MMTNDRFDHATRSREWAEAAERPDLDAELTSSFAQIAIAHAQLALVEQQRIANLIALGGPTHPKLCEQVSSDAATALTEWNSHQNTEMGGWYALRPEVAAALGIEEVQS